MSELGQDPAIWYHSLVGHTSQSCRFCSLPAVATEPWDRLIDESPNFYVLPSKGALVPGWLLVVPRAHVLSLAQLDGSVRAELDAVVQRTVLAVGREYQAPTLFEHGAAIPQSTFGCGIDHAHLHVVPLGFSLAEAAADLVDVPWHGRNDAPWSGLWEIGRPYVAVREPGCDAWQRAHPGRLVSQMFRRAIARSMGRPDAFHYDEFPHPDAANDVARRLG